jgi:hypothetical protein
MHVILSLYQMVAEPHEYTLPSTNCVWSQASQPDTKLEAAVHTAQSMLWAALRGPVLGYATQSEAKPQTHEHEAQNRNKPFRRRVGQARAWGPARGPRCNVRA